MKTLNCLVFDDHPLVGVAIKSTLTTSEYVDNISIAYTVKKAFKELKSRTIDLIILDINLSDSDGYDFYRRIKLQGYKGKVLFYSAEESPLFSKMAFNSGADGYVCKSEQQNVLKDAVEGIANGYKFFKFKSGTTLSNESVVLSNREAVIMNHLLKGKTNKGISELLSISDKTVSTYKMRVLKKYGVNNLVDLSRVVN